MAFASILVGNRGEIAIRIARAASAMATRSVMVYSSDDETSLHTLAGDVALPLQGAGPRAYLDGAQLIALAQSAACDAVHPAYGFLAENAGFARACHAAGLRFIGPNPSALQTFGDKTRARRLALECGVPILKGTNGPTELGEALDFFADLGENAAMMIKAVAGGGGRGMRIVTRREDIAKAYSRCRSEAGAAFGDDSVYVEQLIRRARHIEVQIAGDQAGRIVHFGDRECSIQRRHQKLIEVAPAPNLPERLRERLVAGATALGRAASYDSLGTVEFLIDANSLEDSCAKKDVFAFIEANPRLQVEHTVTEEVTGVDLVQVQIQLAFGRSLESLNLSQQEIPGPQGFAIQLRVNAETLDATGVVKPSGGTLTAYEPPSGPGVRVDGYGYAGYSLNPNFDSLLAKVIAFGRVRDLSLVAGRAARALEEFRIAGVKTTIPLLAALLRHPDFTTGQMTTQFVEDNAEALLGMPSTERHFADTHKPLSSTERISMCRMMSSSSARRCTGCSGCSKLPSEIVFVRGNPVAVVEALKMENLVVASNDGIVRTLVAELGRQIAEDAVILFLDPADHGEEAVNVGTDFLDPDYIRPDLAEVRARHYFGLDESRPDAVSKRRKLQARTARENIGDIL